MQRGRPTPREWAIGPAALLVVCACSCSTPAGDRADAPESSANAALSSAAQASPGAYGTPADPSLPNPTDVAVDPTAATVSGASASVVVTYSGWVDASSSVEVGAYVAGVVESDGTCTLTLTGPGASRTATVTGEADAGSTSCPTMVVPGSQLTGGSWGAVVGYRSPDVSGTSSSVTVDVP